MGLLLVKCRIFLVFRSDAIFKMKLMNDRQWVHIDIN